MEAYSAAPRRSARGVQLPRSPRILAALGDDRLVEQVRRGNDAAFEAIFDRYHRGILSFARHMLSSAEEAEDVVQHTFAQAYDSMRRGDRELKLKAWLYTIARNRSLSVLRARREQAAELEELPTAGLSDAVLQRAELRDLLSDLRQLPEDQRAALVLSEMGDLSHAEIATVVGCEDTKVKSLVFQARSSLLETRKARETPCHEIREHLATASGGELRRGPLRRHLKHCGGCSEFRDDVRRQRAMLAAALPVVPSLALKKGALAAAGVGGGATAAGGGAAAGGGLVSLVGSSAAGKTVALIAISGAVGGGAAVTQKVIEDVRAPAANSAPAERSFPATTPGTTTAPGDPAARSGDRGASAPGREHDRGARGEERSANAPGKGNRPAALDGKPGRGNGRAENHLSPHAQGGPLPSHVDNVPGSGGNGQALPESSNGGTGGGNGGNHSGATQGGGSQPTAPGRSSDAPGQSGATGRPAAPGYSDTAPSLPQAALDNSKGGRIAPPDTATE
jgi:RNA polymerase sigma factor (sigma-70 family)